MRFYAPYRKFRAVVDNHTFYFINGRLDTDDRNVIVAIKKIPEKMGEIKDQNGKVVNHRKVKSIKKGDTNVKNRQRKVRVQNR